MNFSSHMDIVVTVAVRLVNALTPGQAHGRSFDPPSEQELPAAVTEAMRPHRPGMRDVTYDEAVEFREAALALREVFDAVATERVDDAAALVNALLLSTGARPWLDRHDGEPWHLHFHGAQDTVAAGWAAGCATGIAVVLGSDLGGRLGVCTADRCDRVYVDTSKNGTRRFCSTACQNRVKAAAFRARQADDGSEGELSGQPSRAQQHRPR
ncbi:MAG TPA: CGNR zinc finger domain-containing protein [Streptosporangiaceae bacterium]|nr:CGNR zinc finger domain-containing protein [Streptosporangiaceae bacterium]